MLRHLLKSLANENLVGLSIILILSLQSILSFGLKIQLQMSSKNSIRLPLEGSNIDVFTFGQTTLYGYDSVNHSLVLHSLIHFNQISNDRLHLSSSPTWPIRRLVLNEDETILALLADKIAYLVYLTPSKSELSKTSSRLCPIFRVPPTVSSSSSIICSLIDFVWLTANHFALVYSIPSSSECHLYTIRPSKQDGLEHLRTFSVGISSSNKFGTPNKKISLHQPSDIIKLDVARRKEKDSQFILLFAMKSDGDLFLLEIQSNELLPENLISSDFQGPIRILPSTFDNYGADRGQSTFFCLTRSNSPLLIFTRDRCQLNQCILLSPLNNPHCLFTIDSISFPTDQLGQMVTTMIEDPFSAKRYFIADSMGNVYSIEVSWIEQIQQGSKQIPPTHIQHLISGDSANKKTSNQIEQIGIIQSNHALEVIHMIVCHYIEWFYFHMENNTNE